MPKYFYMAKEFEMLNKDIDSIIHCYTSAIWERPLLQITNINKIANTLFRYYENIDETNKNYFKYKLIKLDYLRRLKQFQEASDLIQSLYSDNNFPVEYRVVLDLQKELINKQYIDEHEMPKIEKKEE